MSKRTRRSTANYEEGAASVDAQHNRRKEEEARRMREAILYVLQERAQGRDRYGIISEAARKYDLLDGYGAPKSQLLSHHIKNQLLAEPDILERLGAVAELDAEDAEEAKREKKKPKTTGAASTGKKAVSTDKKPSKKPTK